MKNSILEKLKKIYQLQERGEGGEKHKATFILNKLLLKYGLTLNDLKSQELKVFKFFYKNKHEKTLIFQLFFAVTNLAECSYSTESKKKCLQFELTYIQGIEMGEMWKYYRPIFNKRMAAKIESFKLAFILKYGLSSDNPDTNTESNLSELELLEIMQMAESLKDRGFNKTKQLNEN